MSVSPEIPPDNNFDIKLLNIKKCRCNVIISKDKETCECGETIKSHSIEAQNTFNENGSIYEKWDEKNCTKDDEDTDAYGEISFQGASDTLSKYVRASFRTDMNVIWELLFSEGYWHLKKPNLIISVTGGAENLSLNSTLKDTFSKGLVKVATTTNAIITSGGTYNGCMKLIGEAFKENALSVDPSKIVTVLGIANWGSIHNNKNLITNKPQVVEYELIRPANVKKNKSGLLDPNHSHFLLIDNARSSFGDENEFRAELEALIAKNLDIPIAVLVVAGGPRTAELISRAVNNNTPCVFLENSGDVADTFSYAIKKVEKFLEQKKEKSNKFKDLNEFLQNDEFKQEIRERVEDRYKGQTDKINKIIGHLTDTLKEEKLHLLTVCRPVNGHAEIDVAILRALLKAKTNDSRVQISLALEWDRIDITRNFIFTDQKKDTIGALDEFMICAITNNRVEFVKLFLENGFSLKNFVTARSLIKIYNELPEKDAYLRRYIFNSRTFDKGERLSFKLIGCAIESLLDNFYDHKFTSSSLSKLTHKELSQILKHTNKDGKKNKETVGKYTGNEENLIINIDDKMEFAEHELFILNVLAGRDEMSRLFCLEGKNSMGAALVASKVFKEYASIFEDERDRFIETAKKFETLACDILQTCYDEDKEKAEITLTRRIAEFENSTPMQLAMLANDLNFIAHQCFQNVVEKIWYFRIEPDIHGFWVVPCIICPVLAPVMFYLKQQSIDHKQHSNEKKPDEEMAMKVISRENVRNSRTSLVSKANLRQEPPKAKSFNPVESYLDFLNTPCIKFVYNQFFYLLFLILYSYVILCDFNRVGEAFYSSSLGLAISIPEIVLIIWVITFACELVRKFLSSEEKILKARVARFFSSLWNLIEIGAIVIFFIGIVLRFIPDDNCYVAARIILSVDIIVWFFKSLYTYLFLKNLGPKIYMIAKMLVQLLYFLLIVVLFMFAFGVSSTSLMYPNSNLNIDLLKTVFFPAYFVSAGEYISRDVIMAGAFGTCDENSTNLGPYDSCPDRVGASVTLGIYVVYLVFLNILLINLLIAIFNNTYDGIEAEANEIWSFQRYGLVYDFHTKSIFFPPFTIIYYIYELFKVIFQCIHKSSPPKSNSNTNTSHNKYINAIVGHLTRNKNQGFVHEFENPNEEQKIIKWEKIMTNELINQQESKRKDCVDYKVDESHEKLEVLVSKLESIESGNKSLNERIESLTKNISNIVSSLK